MDMSFLLSSDVLECTLDFADPCVPSVLHCSYQYSQDCNSYCKTWTIIATLADVSNYANTNREGVFMLRMQMCSISFEVILLAISVSPAVLRNCVTTH